MLLYAVQNADEATIMRVAFKFISDRDLMQALTRTIEGSIRAFVATKRQAEIQGLRKEIVEFVKDRLIIHWKNGAITCLICRSMTLRLTRPLLTA